MDEWFTITILDSTSSPVVFNSVSTSSLACGLLSTTAPLPVAGWRAVLVVMWSHKLVLLEFYQFLSLCMFDLIRVMLRLLLVIIGNSFFKLGVNNGGLAFFSTFSCGGHFGHGFREVVFFQMFLAVGFRLQRRQGKGWECDDFNFHSVTKLGFMC